VQVKRSQLSKPSDAMLSHVQQSKIKLIMYTRDLYRKVYQEQKRFDKSFHDRWDVGSWSTCSELCGEGLKTRTVHCQQRISPTLTMRVVEGACLKAKPESQTKCFIRPCHRWEASEWSQVGIYTLFSTYV